MRIKKNKKGIKIEQGGERFNFHKLKCTNPFFQQTLKGQKNWELRKNDRNYQIGDWIILQEHAPESDEFSGNFIAGQIVNILQDSEGLKKGYCILYIHYYKDINIIIGENN
jgi:hypothetical protein